MVRFGGVSQTFPVNLTRAGMSAFVCTLKPEQSLAAVVDLRCIVVDLLKNPPQAKTMYLHYFLSIFISLWWMWWILQEK